MNKLLIIIIFLSYILSVKAQGLQFYGNEKDIANRSSLSIPAEEKDARSIEEFDISFDLRIHNLNSPGNIVYLHNQSDKDGIALTFHYHRPSDNATFILAKNGERNLFSTTLKGDKVLDKTIHTSIKINKDTGIIKISIGPYKSTISAADLNKTQFAPIVYFGMGKQIIESASFTIKNLIIGTEKGKTYIPLCENSGNAVHDSEGNEIGIVSNPKWLINKAFYWTTLWKSCSSTPTGFALNKESNKFISYNSDSLKTYDIHEKTVKAMPLCGDSLRTRLGMNIFDEDHGKIIPYEIYNKAVFSEIDPESGKCTTIKQTDPDAVWHHHATAYRKKDNTLLMFGGYGVRAYSDKLVRYNLNSHIWDTIPLHGDRIDPRFYASMMLTPSEDSLYIYGGKGNKEGLQDLGTKYYYDLHLVNLKNGKVTKLWEQPLPKEDRVPARTLIPDNDGKHFYAAVYPEYRPHSAIQLYRVNISDGNAVAVGDTIPFISEEIATNVALYSHPTMERIYCVVQQFEKYGETTTTVYSISTPPVSASQLNYFSWQENKNKLITKYLLCAISPILLAILIFLLIKRKSRRSSGTRLHSEADYQCLTEEQESLPTDNQDLTTAPTEQQDNNDENQNTAAEDISDSYEAEKNCIDIFGAFTAKDSSGHSISHLFSPKLKLIFIYILLHTINRDGVTSSDLNSTFWADKDPEKVKNLRNVTLTKLRKVLSEIEGLSLVFEQGSFRIDVTDPCLIDIQRFYTLTSSLSDAVPSPIKAKEINHIIMKGKFLADINDPIFDYFRQKIDAYEVKYLSAVISTYYKDGKYDLVRRLCHTLQQTDPISGLALKYLIRVARDTRRFDRAQAIYTAFRKDYLKMMGEEYPVAFEDIR